MQIPLVMTVIGHDRPGLVERVARLVAEQGGNWLESRMCRLGGEFAGLLRVHVPSEREPAPRAGLAAMATEGLTVVVQADRAAAPPPSLAALLELVGHDRPGIVREISAVLAARLIGICFLDVPEACSNGKRLSRRNRVELPLRRGSPALRGWLAAASQPRNAPLAASAPHPDLPST